MKQPEQFFIKIENVNYPVKVIYKQMRNVIFRYRDNSFLVSAPPYARKEEIYRGIVRFAPRLLKQNQNISTSEQFLFGIKQDAPMTSDDRKQKLYDYAYPRMLYYAQLMEAKRIYQLRIRDMTTRYGTNSRRTNTITLAGGLVSYDKAVIDAVIAHEMAHDAFFNHGNDFYQHLLTVCPNYMRLRRQIRKGVFHDERNNESDN